MSLTDYGVASFLSRARTHTHIHALTNQKSTNAYTHARVNESCHARE